MKKKNFVDQDVYEKIMIAMKKVGITNAILSFLANALFSSFVTNLLKCLVFFNLLNIGVINHKINGNGSKLPIKHIINAGTMSRPNNAAAISPPLNSRIGIKEIINTINSLPCGILFNPSNKPKIVCTKLSAI